MNNQHYVYKIIDPINNQPFYIGKGQGTRMYSHLLEARKPRNKWKNINKCIRINKIHAHGHNLVYIKKYFNTEVAALKYERFLIKKYGRIVDGSGVLTNIHPGGFDHINMPKRTPVDCFTLDGVYITTYPSIHQASRETNISIASINHCCRNYKNTSRAKNFIFKYSSNTQNICSYTNSRCISIFVYDLNANLIGTFKSFRDASKFCNLNESYIANVIKRNKHNTIRCKQFMFSLEDNIKQPYKDPILKPVKVIFNDNTFKIFNSIKDAGEALKIYPSGICECLKGKHKTYKGLKFTYLEEVRL